MSTALTRSSDPSACQYILKWYYRSGQVITAFTFGCFILGLLLRDMQDDVGAAVWLSGLVDACKWGFRIGLPTFLLFMLSVPIVSSIVGPEWESRMRHECATGSERHSGCLAGGPRHVPTGGDLATSAIGAAWQPWRRTAISTTWIVLLQLGVSYWLVHHTLDRFALLSYAALGAILLAIAGGSFPCSGLRRMLASIAVGLVCGGLWWSVLELMGHQWRQGNEGMALAFAAGSAAPLSILIAVSAERAAASAPDPERPE